MITCHDVNEWILDYLSGELSPESRNAMDQHLSACPTCVAFVQSYSMTISLSRRLAVQPTPPELIERIQVRFARTHHANRL